jgi:hypothetical protein
LTRALAHVAIAGAPPYFLMSTIRCLSPSVSGRFSVVNSSNFRSPPGARIDRKSIEYLPLLSQWVRFAKNLWTTDRGPTLASLDVVFMADFVRRRFHEGPWVRSSRSPERHGLIRSDVPDFNGFVSQKRFVDRTYFPKVICDQRFVRLDASFRRPQPRNQSPESLGSFVAFPPSAGRFVARRESGSFCPSTATRDNGPRTKKTIPPLLIMCAAYTFARSFDDFRKDAIGTIDAIEKRGKLRKTAPMDSRRSRAFSA